MFALCMLMFFSQVGSFLLNNDTRLFTNSGSALTDKHFVTVIDMLTEEKESRTKLEQYIIILRGEFDGVKQELQTVKENHSYEIAIVRNESAILNRTVQLLTEETNQLHKDKNKLSEIVKNCDNKVELFAIALQDIRNMTTDHSACNCQNFIEEPMSKIQLLVQKSKAGSREIQTLFTETNTTKRFLRRLENDIAVLQTSQNQTNSLLVKNIESLNREVVLSACASNGSLLQGDAMLFPQIINSNGISNLSRIQTTGQFTCEVPGLYLISAYVMSYSQFSSFYVLKNGNAVSEVYIKGSEGQPSRYGTGTSIQALYLNTGDTIMVKAAYPMYVYGSQYSCLTIVKIK